MTRHFIPKNEDQAQALKGKLEGTIIQTVDNFVNYYNAEYINRRHPSVQETMLEIINTYKDVKLQGNKLVLISEEEVVLSEILQKLAPWDLLTKVKREISNAVQDGHINSDAILVLDESGFFSRITDEGEHDSLRGEKMFNKNDDISVLLTRSSYGSNFDDEHHGYLFKAQDILDIDGSFIIALQENIPQL